MQSLPDIADDLKLLGDKTRLIILTLLKEREWCVCEFVDLFNITQPAISQHLRKLKNKGIVSEKKRGQWVHYSLTIEDKPHLQAVLREMPSSESILVELNKEPQSTEEINAVCCE